jgi:hypothetical protein
MKSDVYTAVFVLGIAFASACAGSKKPPMVPDGPDTTLSGDAGPEAPAAK